MENEYDFVWLPLLRWVWDTPDSVSSEGWCGVEGSEQHRHWQEVLVDKSLELGEWEHDVSEAELEVSVASVTLVSVDVPI